MKNNTEGSEEDCKADISCRRYGAMLSALSFF